ncbi:hypothetical protein [Streptomyces sp. NPDC048242]|uniref:hypothetical protein n=1 Tax=Streptomyces sp. NPDC048242 TaxID=3155026 RepID=UPI00342C2367
MLSAVVWLWMYEILPIPTGQIKRALRTFVEADAKLPWVAERKGIRMLIDSIAHPSTPKIQYRKALAVMEQAAQAHEWDLDLIESVLTEVASPWPAPPRQRIERGIPNGAGKHIGVSDIIRAHQVGMTVVPALRAESVSERELDIARQRYMYRHGAEGLQFTLAAQEGIVVFPGAPTDHSLGHLFFEIEHVITRRARSESGSVK